MNISDILITMDKIIVEQTTKNASRDSVQPGLFPFPFGLHLGFACIAFIFLVFRFSTNKRPYQLIMAIAVPFSLVMWLSEKKFLFFTVGIIEALLLLAAIVTSIVFRDKRTTEEIAEAAAEEVSSDESEE